MANRVRLLEEWLGTLLPPTRVLVDALEDILVDGSGNILVAQ